MKFYLRELGRARLLGWVQDDVAVVDIQYVGDMPGMTDSIAPFLAAMLTDSIPAIDPQDPKLRAELDRPDNPLRRCGITAGTEAPDPQLRPVALTYEYIVGEMGLPEADPGMGMAFGALDDVGPPYRHLWMAVRRPINVQLLTALGIMV